MNEITGAVDAAFDEQVGFLAELVREPSLMGAESGGQKLMADAMARSGLAVDQWQLDAAALRHMDGFGTPVADYDGMTNVVGVARSDVGSGRSLILNGHIDVVPTGPADKWTRDPFDPWIEDGWLHGRGSADMKAGLVAALFAWDALRRAGVQLSGDLVVQSVVEEESTGNGSLACLQRGYTADAAIIPEATSETWVHSQVGLIWFRLHVDGDPRHASLATTANAIEHAFEVFRGLKSIEDEWNERRTDFPAFAGIERPVKLLLGRVHGGDWPSSSPTSCTLECRIGLYPGVHPDEIRTQVEERVAGAAEVEWAGHYGAGYAVTGADDLIEVLGAAHQSISGAPLIGIPSTGSSDARVLGLQGGIPSILYGPRGRNYHAYDEAVELESMRRVTKALALFAAGWCGTV